MDNNTNTDTNINTNTNINTLTVVATARVAAMADELCGGDAPVIRCGPHEGRYEVEVNSEELDQLLQRARWEPEIGFSRGDEDPHWILVAGARRPRRAIVR